MTQLIDPTPPASPADTDLVASILQVLASSTEPQTGSKIRSQLPSNFRQINLEELTDVLRRKVAANALHQYPPYRSQQDRFWDRSMPSHIAELLRSALQEGPLPWSQLRRKLPVYALAQSQAVLDDQLAQGRIYRHPRGEGRGSERLGLQPPDAKEYLEQELSLVFQRLEQLGFHQSQIRVAALELLHNDEWAPAPPAPRTPPQAEATGLPVNPPHLPEAPESVSPSGATSESGTGSLPS